MVYTVGEMAKLLGVTASTLRYYDKEGSFRSLNVLPAEYECSVNPILSG